LIAQVGRLSEHSQILEIGVGTGRIALPVSRHVGSYFGIDLAVPMLNKLREKKAGEAVYVARADATQLPFPDSSFDAVIAVHVFHLIPTWQQALAELGRVLKPGAPLLSCWNASDEDPRVKALWQAWNTVIPEERRQSVGANARSNPNFLLDQGWRLQTHAHYTFTRTMVPAEFLDLMRRRIFSRLWSLSDEDLATGIAAMEQAAAAQFGSLDEVIHEQHSFHIQALLPPGL
jgi:SAM-dependent methyltransferase